MESYNQIPELFVNLLQLKQLSEEPTNAEKDGFLGYDENNIYFAVNGAVKKIPFLTTP
jgi:hypothetical protein